MNQSLETIATTTTNPIVATWAKFLLDNKGHRFIATFTKQNGEERELVFVPRNQYNTMMGIQTTESGRKMVITKAHRDMMTVVEFFRPEGVIGAPEAIRCRTLNLAAITTLRIAA